MDKDPVILVECPVCGAELEEDIDYYHSAGNRILKDGTREEIRGAEASISYRCSENSSHEIDDELLEQFKEIIESKNQ